MTPLLCLLFSLAADPAAPAGELLFPLDNLHNHSASIVQLPDGSLLAAWYRGSGEGQAADVRVMGARRAPGEAAWSDPVVLADAPEAADLNPVLVLAAGGKLWLFYSTFVDKTSAGVVLKYQIADTFDAQGLPVWGAATVLDCAPPDFSAAFGAVQEEIKTRRAGDLEKNEALRRIVAEQDALVATEAGPILGWMTRTAPISLPDGRMMIGLYHDVFACALTATTKDAGASWNLSAPIQSAYRGGIQPALAQRKDGSLIAFLRDNGKLRQVRRSVSTDGGKTWSEAAAIDLPNPGSSVAVQPLRTGAWLLVCNDLRSGRHRLSVYLSEDEGASWPIRRVIEDLGEGKGEVHYPSVIQTADGCIELVYTYSLPPATPDVRNESIKHVRLDEAWIRGDDEARTLAFPGAEGYGRFARGGRGGDVYSVTTLEDDGPGSLREGLRSARGPRTIIFNVGGTIELKSSLEIVEQSHITIAGQTAPGQGITLKDWGIEIKKSSHLILRYLRLRLGDQNKKDTAPDTLSINYSDNIILDHLSLSWSIDGIQDTRGCANYTMQWCIMSEALHHSIHPEGAHGMCGSFRGPLGNMTLHHNLFATSRDRHPTLGGSVLEPAWLIDFRNNVNYNWSGGANVCDNQVLFVNNYFKPGPETKIEELPIAMKTNLPDQGRGWMSGNVFEQRKDLSADNYAAMDMHRWIRPDTNYVFEGTVEDWKLPEAPLLGPSEPGTESAEQAYDRVLQQAGASRARDAVDQRVINDVREGKGHIIDSQDEVGGWPELKAGEAPPDSDADGMPDAWERVQGFDPDDGTDGNTDADGDGYTNLEEYLADLVLG